MDTVPFDCLQWEGSKSGREAYMDSGKITI